MKKILSFSVLPIFLCSICKAQNIIPNEHWLTARFIPKLTFISNNKKMIPAGFELPIHGIFNGCGFCEDIPYYWTFWASSREGTIGIRTPFVPYDSTRKTILRITDTTKTVCRIVPYDSIRERIPEIIYYGERLKVEPFLRRKRNRENMIITNDSLTIYLINIRSKHLETVRKTVTTPIDTN